MPETTLQNLGLKSGWNLGESNWHTGMDANLAKLDALVHLAVPTKSLADPPGTPAEGDRYIIASTGATGAWATYENHVALREASGWTIYVPNDDWLAYVDDEKSIFRWDGTNWVAWPGSAPHDVIHDMASDADYTVTAAESESEIIQITDTGTLLTTERNIVLPNDLNRRWIVINETAHPLTFKTAAGTGVSVAAGTTLMLRGDGTNIDGIGGAGGSSESFLSLTDTPANYIGQAGQQIRVNGTEDGLEFHNPYDTFLELQDTPGSYTAQALKVLRVNAAANAIEFFTPPTTFVGLTDTPSAFTGAALQIPRVNVLETALEFFDNAFTALGDTPAAYTGQAGKAPIVNQTEDGLEFGDPGVANFTELNDTPADYVGQANAVVRVNASANALVFSGFDITSLTDTPSAYTGEAGNVLVVNQTEDGMEFGPISTTFPGLTDTPNSYAGEAGSVPVVNQTEDGMEFNPFSFLGLPDTPSGYIADYYLKVNAAGTAIELTADGGGTGGSGTDCATCLDAVLTSNGQVLVGADGTVLYGEVPVGVDCATCVDSILTGNGELLIGADGTLLYDAA